MTVSFIGSEATALTLANASEVTTGSTFRSANSRGSIAIVTNTQSAYAEWATAPSEGWVHFVMQGTLDNDQSDLIVVVTNSSSGNLFRLILSNIATVQAQYWNGSAWTNTGSSFAFSTSALEVAIHLVAGASGSWEVFQNSVSKGSGSVAFSGTDMKRATFYCPDDNFTQYFSEVMLGDEDVSLVTSVVETEAPTANGTDTDGTGSYTDVDEIPLSDADSIALANAGDANSFTSPARTSTLYTVLGVSVAARMKRDVSGPQSAKFYLKIGGTPYYSSTFALTTGFASYQYTWALDPSTGVAWVPADASSASLEWGIEAVA